MPLAPIELPPGIYKNSTDYGAKGRWVDGNMVRWRDGRLRPVGGWTTAITGVTGTDPVESGAIWVRNNGTQVGALGTVSGLFALSTTTVTDITPAGLGGVLRSTWSLDNWGEYLVACLSDDGDIYEWQLTGTPTVISGAPTGCQGIVVTDDRFLFALGAGGNPRKVQWSDREDNTTWTAAADNEAGDYELKTDGRILSGCRWQGSTVIFTDKDIHIAEYIGPPFVYSFRRAGTACGMVAPNAYALTPGAIFWMGFDGFYAFDGSTVTRLDCDVRDYVYEDINLATDVPRTKFFASHISAENEVWFFYAPAGTSGPSRAVYYDYRDNWWGLANISRSAAIDQFDTGRPMWFNGTTGLLQENGDDRGEIVPYAETGPLEIDVGDQTFTVTSIYPDDETQGDVRATLKTKYQPNGPETSHGPYSLIAPTSVRATGRQVKLRLTQAVETSWRVGVPRLEFRARGRR